MLIIYCIGLFDGCFGSGVWQCWNCRCRFFVGMERDARGRWHRSGEWMQAGCFAVLWGGWRGTPEKGGIGPGVDAGGMFLRF